MDFCDYCGEAYLRDRVLRAGLPSANIILYIQLCPEDAVRVINGLKEQLELRGLL